MADSVFHVGQQALTVGDAVLWGVLAVLAVLYSRGVVSRRERGASTPSVGIRLLFVGGLFLLAIVLSEPFDEIVDSRFWPHMLQHLVLILVVPPLLLAGRPIIPVVEAAPTSAKRVTMAWRKLLPKPIRNLARIAIIVWIFHVAVVWLWHAPALFDAALRFEPLHVLEHLLFLATALLFWWPIMHSKARRRMGEGLIVAYSAAAGVQGAALGALLTFAPRPLYAPYAIASSSPAALTPLQDQQLAGLIMWIPAGVVYLFIAGLIFLAWIRRVERELDDVQMCTPIRPPTDTWSGNDHDRGGHREVRREA